MNDLVPKPLQTECPACGAAVPYASRQHCLRCGWRGQSQCSKCKMLVASSVEQHYCPLEGVFVDRSEEGSEARSLMIGPDADNPNVVAVVLSRAGAGFMIDLNHVLQRDRVIEIRDLLTSWLDSPESNPP